MSTTVEVKDLATQWRTILESVRSGEEVVLVDQSIPQARLLPINRRQPGMHPDAIVMGADFDEALPDQFWQGTK
ncbi:MAG TPA: hypothetical protein VFG20_10900 [Planctomycetaceae bacterium]|nr:hypothetical protein [Planctomycetaceae bacterium]